MPHHRKAAGRWATYNDEHRETMTYIKNIWIESEVMSPIVGGEKYINDNSDVIVTDENSNQYVATFFTYANIEHLRKKNEETGECNFGKYFWASDMIIVDRIDRKTIEETIDYLLLNDNFYQIFNKIN